MKVLFTRSSLPLSKMICDITGEPVSHTAILYKGIVYHSSLLGVDAVSYEEFLAKQDFVMSLDVEYVEGLEDKYKKYKHSWYDIGALLYLGLRYLIPAVPKANLWQSTGMFMCTEWVTEVLDGEEHSTITPYDLYKRLNNNIR